MMAVMVMLYTTVLSTKMKNADGRSGHGGGEAEGQWIKEILKNNNSFLPVTRLWEPAIESQRCPACPPHAENAANTHLIKFQPLPGIQNNSRLDARTWDQQKTT